MVRVGRVTQVQRARGTGVRRTASGTTGRIKPLQGNPTERSFTSTDIFRMGDIVEFSENQSGKITKIKKLHREK